MTYQNSPGHKANARAALEKAFQRQKELKAEREAQYQLNPKRCDFCNESIQYGKHGRFCSKSHAAQFNNRLRAPRTEESKKRTSDTMAGRKPSPDRKGVETKLCRVAFKECVSCQKTFVVRTWGSYSNKTCSDECRTYAKTANRTYQNGSRKPVRFFNPYEDKEVILDSSWEKRVAEYLIEKGIRWVRPH